MPPTGPGRCVSRSGESGLVLTLLGTMMAVSVWLSAVFTGNDTTWLLPGGAAVFVEPGLVAVLEDAVLCHQQSTSRQDDVVRSSKCYWRATGDDRLALLNSRDSREQICKIGHQPKLYWIH